MKIKFWNVDLELIGMLSGLHPLCSEELIQCQWLWVKPLFGRCKFQLEGCQRSVLDHLFIIMGVDVLHFSLADGYSALCVNGARH